MKMLLVCFMVVLMAVDARCATIQEATAAADSGNLQEAVTQYEELLKSEWPQETLSGIVDGYTDTLAKAGSYATAITQINDFLARYPADPLADKLSARRVSLTYQQKNYPATVQLAKDFLAAYPAENAYTTQTQSLLIDGLMGKASYQELVNYVDQTLTAAPSHVSYALFRQKQADALADGLYQFGAAHQQFKDAMAHTSADSAVYEYSMYRSGNVLLTESKRIMGKDPKRYDELTSHGFQVMKDYLAQPTKDKFYPDNVRRRLKALIYLKRYDQMEQEAALYLNDTAHITSLEKIKTLYMLGVARAYGVSQANRDQKDLAGAIRAFDEILTITTEDKKEENAFRLLAAKWGIDLAYQSGDPSKSKPYIIFIRDRLPESKDRTMILNTYKNVLEAK